MNNILTNMNIIQKKMNYIEKEMNNILIIINSNYVKSTFYYFNNRLNKFTFIFYTYFSKDCSFFGSSITKPTKYNQPYIYFLSKFNINSIQFPFTLYNFNNNTEIDIKNFHFTSNINIGIVSHDSLHYTQCNDFQFNRNFSLMIPNYNDNNDNDNNNDNTNDNTNDNNNDNTNDNTNDNNNDNNN
jgi:hypothetical protein